MNQNANQLGGRVVTLSEAATILRISRGSAYEAAKRGEIPTIRIGRRWLVPLAALDRMLAAELPKATKGYGSAEPILHLPR